MSTSTSPADELDALIAALNPENPANTWSRDISGDLEYTLYDLVKCWPSLRDDNDLLRAIRTLLGGDASDGDVPAQRLVQEACVRLLCAVLQVHAEDGGDSLTYGAVLNLDTALDNLTSAISELKAELGHRAVAS